MDIVICSGSRFVLRHIAQTACSQKGKTFTGTENDRDDDTAEMMIQSIADGN